MLEIETVAEGDCSRKKDGMDDCRDEEKLKAARRGGAVRLQEGREEQISVKRAAGPFPLGGDLYPKKCREISDLVRRLRLRPSYKTHLNPRRAKPSAVFK